jgi:hypothetical protein
LINSPKKTLVGSTFRTEEEKKNKNSGFVSYLKLLHNKKKLVLDRRWCSGKKKEKKTGLSSFPG